MKIAGLINLHSHAFQRAMAGRSEVLVAGRDDFWSWREAMYRLAERLDPEALRDVAALAYCEMLEAGFTRVCEFHYLHHEPDGQRYAEGSAMSQALIQAADDVGIRLTLLPVLYMTGGFDGRDLQPRQRRFGHALSDFIDLVGDLRRLEGPQLTVGMALHSLRAVPVTAMQELLGEPLAASGPIHIHIAEQIAEVTDCVAVRGARPVAWLLDHAPVDRRWTLVHATHMQRREVMALAHSGATAGLCPLTEANLGDGLFPLAAYQAHGGRFGIGSDSNCQIDAAGELRTLEYGQRLRHRRRNVAAGQGGSTAEVLLAAMVESAADAAGAIDDGDWVELEPTATFVGDRQQLLDHWIFAPANARISRVTVGDRCVVEAGRHISRSLIERRYGTQVKRLEQR